MLSLHQAVHQIPLAGPGEPALQLLPLSLPIVPCGPAHYDSTPLPAPFALAGDKPLPFPAKLCSQQAHPVACLPGSVPRCTSAVLLLESPCAVEYRQAPPSSQPVQCGRQWLYRAVPSAFRLSVYLWSANWAPVNAWSTCPRNSATSDNPRLPSASPSSYSMGRDRSTASPK